MQTLLALATTTHTWDTTAALIGDDAGQISGVALAPQVVAEQDRLFKQPCYVTALTVRIPNAPA